MSVGGDDNMRIAISSFDMDVRCDRRPVPGPPFESCLHIVADMEADTERKVFGNRGEPRVQVNLPIVFKASESRHAV